MFWDKLAKKSVPGPDGISARVLRKMPDEWLEVVQKIFTRYVRRSVFETLKDGTINAYPERRKNRRMKFLRSGQANISIKQFRKNF